MHYDFDHYVDRANTASVKWDALELRFGVTDALPMWIADMDFMTAQPIIEVLQKRVEHGIYGYTLRSDSYFEAIIDWEQRRHHFSVEKDWICHSPGIVSALSCIVRLCTKPGDSVIIQTPVYYPFRMIAERHGCEVVSNPLKYEHGEYRMDYQDLEEKAAQGAKLLILCSPHNPVGRVWTREELERLGRICQKYQMLVIADEIHGDLIYEGHTHIPFASLSEEFARFSITCIAASKTFNLAGLQTSTVIIADPQLRERYIDELNTLHLGGSNIFGPVATESAYRYGEEWLDQLLVYLQGNRDFLINYFVERIPQIKVIRPQGTYLLWLDCRELGLTVQELDEFFLKRARIAFDEGHIFGPEGEGFGRLNIACPRAIVEEACQRIEHAVNSR